MTDAPDFCVTSLGSICLLRPITEAATEWLAANISPEPWQMVGGALTVEHRYIGDIVDGIQGDGLVVS